MAGVVFKVTLIAKRLSLSVLLVLLFVGTSVAFGQRVLVVYYSKDGHTAALAEAVAKGARSIQGVSVKLLPVAEATNNDVLAADAIILGSPVYNANVAPAMQSFINGWPFQGQPLKDKIGAAFVTGGGISAGEEITQLNLLQSMLMFNMIVVGGNSWRQAFGASGITDEEPFAGGGMGERLQPQFLAKGVNLGKRVAELALVLHQSR